MATHIARVIAATCALWLACGCEHSPLSSTVADTGPPLDDAVRQKVLDATLEIVPEIERSSVVGTAFSIGNGEFATAAHVLERFIGSGYPRPVFRAANGRQYPVDQVVKFTNEGDGEFAVVTLKGAPAIPPLVRVSGELRSGDALWFAGRRSMGGISIENATLLPLQPGSDGIFFEGPVAEGYSGGPIFDRKGNVVGLTSSGDPAKKRGRMTLIADLDDAGETLEVYASTLISALGAARLPKRDFSESLTVGSTFDEFSSALLVARRALYEKTLFNPDAPRATRFVFLDARSPATCELLNGARCMDVTGNTAGAETWPLADETGDSPALQLPESLTPGAPPVYSIQGAILVRDVPRPKAVPPLSRRAGIHWNLAHRCFEEPRLRILLGSSLDPLQEKAPLSPKTEPYTDAQGRTWTLRTWKLGNEDFYIVSLGREATGGRSHIVLARVVTGPQVDGATVLLKYVANFTFSASGGIAPSDATGNR